MPYDLAVLVPSRGRPENLKRLMDACHSTSRGTVHVITGVDEDDPRLADYRRLELADGDTIITSHQRRNLVNWTNHLARLVRGEYRYLASFGDDMIPRTPGWDTKLWGAIEEDFGIGFSYPWDAIRDDIPEAYVLSASIEEALGWVMMPKLNHWYNDNVIADLGHGAQCIRQLRGVYVEHANTGTGKAPVDQTAIDQGSKIPEDEVIYREWFRSPQRFTDIQVIKDLRHAAS